MLFNTLTGTALQSAQLSIARYCLHLEEQSGAIDLLHVIRNLNEEYKFVPKDQVCAFTNDISNALCYIKNQQTTEMSRAGYWKFKALSPFAAKQVLSQELAALGV
ncbi:hypothetical protein ACLINR_004561 [Vibrio parahaemolyticus]|uniref:hypothetical protein n=1 Tax=Vibrio parahaemolyticus TaxID=670 RepID=UPI00084BB42C|nr:hypothetical protein [Vibrio parahaemolyticus]ELB2090436.1 hypothetical protein [Vibrio parahaemolyticus]MBM4805869.1 hypothetical protein [Vibrio parahaemolyticus]OEA20292.1 hypothetical protein BBM55_06970 [Vibrio parahaemolyticus]OEB78922.1 hypothetical protein BBM86_17790 [Vibrio parahaemolyticus]WMO23988.1 hypothetical protein NI374_07095 [Vibrio parahaemolyticus]